MLQKIQDHLVNSLVLRREVKAGEKQKEEER